MEKLKKKSVFATIVIPWHKHKHISTVETEALNIVVTVTDLRVTTPSTWISAVVT